MMRGKVSRCQQVKPAKAGIYAILTNGRIIMGEKTVLKR
jgi:hypothetical protein